MKKLNEIVLKNAQLLSDADMKSIEGGWGAQYRCVYSCTCSSVYYESFTHIEDCSGESRVQEYWNIMPCNPYDCTFVEQMPGDY